VEIKTPITVMNVISDDESEDDEQKHDRKIEGIMP